MGSLADPADLLVIILDLNPFAWADFEVEEPVLSIDLLYALENVLVFANTHLAIKHENALAVYGATIGLSDLLYSSIDSRGETSATSSASARDASTYQTFRVVDDAVSQGVKRLMELNGQDVTNTQPTGTVSALAKALCHINRLAKDNDKKKHPLKPRILMISISPDSPGQYIPMMNCIFSAQKASIPIDVCKVTGQDAVFLQQAAHLTNGIYYRLQKPKAMIQYLTMTFLPGINARKLLNVPQQDEVDLRAACFCHRAIIDIGYVCSVCLSIFCAPTPVCSTCRTKFPISTLKRFIAAMPKQPAKPPNGSVAGAQNESSTLSAPAIPIE